MKTMIDRIPASPPATLFRARLVVVSAVLARAALAVEHPGTGDLLVAPTRVAFEGRQRTAEVALVNTGSRAATYRISFEQLRMNEDGGTSIASKASAGDDSAAELIRFSPRQVTLEPHVSQSVRLQLRLPGDLPDGEYRSHLTFRAIPADAPEADSADGGLAVRLIPVYGVSIPVIVRHGGTEAKVVLSSAELFDGPSGPGLRLRIERNGNRSVHGHLRATIPNGTGEPAIVGQANGVAVYVPNPVRNVTIPLRSALAAPGRTVHVTYRSSDRSGAMLAEADFVLR
jgi:P pilus assembly chaperone PapD